MALRRIAHLLEREGASTYKVRAFRRAAVAVAEVDHDRLAQLAAAGRLGDLPGVGDTTAKVIDECLRGDVPAYLKQLDASPPMDLSPPARALREALRGDFHSHSDWSDGGSPVEEMARTAAELGHRYWALTDHSPRLTVAHGLDAERLNRQLDLVAEFNEKLAPFRILTGMEVDILEDGSLDQEPDMLARLDMVVASAHSKLRMDRVGMTRRLISAIENPHTDVLGHCTGRIIVGRGRPPSSFDADAVFAACADTGTAVEINSRPDRRDPPPDLLRTALDRGCLVTIDSDAHAPGQLEWLAFGCEQAAECAVPPERIVNSWALDEVLGWTAAHAA
jgi:putative hydrolase